MNSPVFASLIPVILFIALGFFVGRRGWIRATSVKDLSNLVFMVLTPALLFRTMSTVHVQDLDFGPVAVYFATAGLIFATTLVVPEVIGKPLQLLGQALGPLALLLVGVTLAFSTVGTHFKAALRIALVKNIVHPLVLGALGWALGLSGLSLAVMVAAAALPVGANVFLFTQRYEVAQDEVTASIAVSTALALITVPVALLLAARL